MLHNAFMGLIKGAKKVVENFVCSVVVRRLPAVQFPAEMLHTLLHGALARQSRLLSPVAAICNGENAVVGAGYNSVHVRNWVAHSLQAGRTVLLVQRYRLPLRLRRSSEPAVDTRHLFVYGKDAVRERQDEARLHPPSIRLTSTSVRA